MRIAIVAESFLPSVNGVVNSVLRVLDYLRESGHEAIVIAPGARDFEEEIPEYAGFPVYRVPTVMVPMVNSIPVGVPTPLVHRVLREWRPDVIHLASPFVLGAAGAFAARKLRIPAVAVYQTDIAGFSTRYHLAPLAAMSWEWTRALHNACARTLAPSTATIRDLSAHGVERVFRWGRGVDATLFRPDRRSDECRRRWDPTGSRPIVGFVGRLAAEKGVYRLTTLARDPGLELVIVGDGPERDGLAELMPRAHFIGRLAGTALAAAYASLDLFVHPGEFETFCQTIQEAQASGVPAIGPRAGGPIDLIDHGRTGLLLDVASFERELPAAVRWVMARREEMGRAARAGVAHRTWDAQCASLVGHYRAAIRESRLCPSAHRAAAEGRPEDWS